MSAKNVNWPPPRLALLERQLDSLAAAVGQSDEREIDEQIWLTRFLIVRACGYLEQVVHETVMGHLDAGSWGTANSFVMSWLDRSRNPSVDNMSRIVGRLDASMQDELEDLLADNDKYLSDRVHLLVGRRNQIAHGENEGLNSNKAIELVAVAKQIANWFILRLNPATRPVHYKQT